MAPRTLASTLKQVERLVKKLGPAETPDPEGIEALDRLIEKTNKSKIVGALATLFVQNHASLDQATVQFALSNGDGRYPEWISAYDAETGVITLNPVGIFEFRDQCEASVETLKTAAARDSFQKYRYHAYLAELRKLPMPLLLYLHILKEVGRARQVTRVEKRGGGTEQTEDEGYMTLLWAFKELEGFFARGSGINLRAEYGMLWYESDWIVGK